MNMTSAEQEHADHVAGSASEFQNCYTEARSECSRIAQEQHALIQQAIEAGKVVIVEDAPYHCKATDAIAGSIPFLHSVHDDRQEAEAAIQASIMPDAEMYILPRLPRPVPVSTDDGIPF